MSIQEIQELIDFGELDTALEKLKEFPRESLFDSRIYSALILIEKGQYQIALQICMNLFSLPEIIRSKIKEQKVDIIKSYALLNLGRLDDCYAITKEVEDYLNGQDEVTLQNLLFYRSILYKTKGTVETRLGKKREALASYHQSLRNIAELGNQALLAAINNNIGHIHTQLGNAEEAFKHYTVSLEIAEELNNDFQIYYPLSNIGIYYYNKGDLDNSFKYHIRALEVAQKTENRSNIASEYREISQLYRAKGDYNQALGYLEDSLKLRIEVGNPIWITYTLIYLVQLALDLDDPEMAMNYSNQLKSIASESGSDLVDQITRMSIGLIHKKSPRLKDKAAAIDIFRQIVDEDTLEYDTTVNSVLHLCELLIFELKLTNEEEVLIELHFLTAKLIQMAEANNSYSLICEILGLQSNIALIEGNVTHALKLLDEAVSLSESNQSFIIANKFSKHKEALLQQSEAWTKTLESSNPIESRMDMSKIEEYLQEIIKIKDNIFQK